MRYVLLTQAHLLSTYSIVVRPIEKFLLRLEVEKLGFSKESSISSKWPRLLKSHVKPDFALDSVFGAAFFFF